MHSDVTKRKQSTSAKKMWEKRTAEEREIISDKLSAIATQRWAIKRVIFGENPACLRCVFFQETGDFVGECRYDSPPSPEVALDGWCGRFCPVIGKTRRTDDTPDLVISGDFNPLDCEYCDDNDLCGYNGHCDYRVQGFECSRGKPPLGEVVQ